MSAKDDGKTVQDDAARKLDAERVRQKVAKARTLAASGEVRADDPEDTGSRFTNWYNR